MRHRDGGGEGSAAESAADDDRARAEYIKAYDRANRAAATFRDQRNLLAIELAKMTGRPWRQVLDDAGMNDVPAPDEGQQSLLEVRDGSAALSTDEEAPEGSDDDDVDCSWTGTGS